MLVAAIAAVCTACGGRGGRDGSRDVEVSNHFPPVKVPSVYTEPEQKQEYILNHYWDNLQGASMDEFEGALANFIGLMEMSPMDVSQKAVGVLFDRICEVDAADTSAHSYVLMTQMVSRYLYDPNSPLRNEDYYLPFVTRMAESPLTSEDMRPAYRFEAESCSICRYGTLAPDFRAKTAAGREFSLYDIGAFYTMLFFSNPGCSACKEIIDQVMGAPGMGELIDNGYVAVVNVYIDEDLDAWREYEPNYPDSWVSCYDFRRVIRNTRLYDVRAIPSLYLLDKDKRILMKDAPTDKVIKRILNQ